MNVLRERYLDRIGYAGPVAPDATTLHALQRAHVHAIPFENLDVYAGVPVRFEPNALFQKIVAGRRGGFCYELNGLFALLLEELGFAVERVSARVMKSDRIGPPFDHLALVVRLERPWLVDVGFGDSPIEPLDVESDDVQLRAASAYRLVPHAAGSLVQHREEGRWVNDYLLDPTPQPIAAFGSMMHYHQSSPDSPFPHRRFVTRPTVGGRITLAHDRLIRTTAEARTEEPLEDQAIPVALAAHFDLRDVPVRGG